MTLIEYFLVILSDNRVKKELQNSLETAAVALIRQEKFKIKTNNYDYMSLFVVYYDYTSLL